MERIRLKVKEECVVRCNGGGVTKKVRGKRGHGGKGEIEYFASVHEELGRISPGETRILGCGLPRSTFVDNQVVRTASVGSQYKPPRLRGRTPG